MKLYVGLNVTPYNNLNENNPEKLTEKKRNIFMYALKAVNDTDIKKDIQVRACEVP